MRKVIRTSFGDLPNEVILRVLHFCQYKTILRFAGTCKRGYEVVKSSLSLQLHIELEENGLEIVEGPSRGSVTCTSALEELRRYRDAWLDLDLSSPVERPIGKQYMRLWELREGSFVKAFSTAGTRQSADSIQIVPLGSPNLPLPVKFQHPFHEFTLDIGQQLVVLVAVDLTRTNYAQVRFCSTITGLSHPLAQHPMLSVQVDFCILHGEPSSVTLEIMGNFLLVKFAHLKSLSYEIVIWNWQSGVLLNRISSRTGICDLAFLDREHLVLYVAFSGSDSYLRSVSLLVYRNITSSREEHDVPLGAHFNVVAYPTLEHTFAFSFPKLHSAMSVLPSALALRADPIPGRVVHSGCTTFACSNAGTLGLVLPLAYNAKYQPQDVTYQIFISASHLLNYMEENEPTGVTALPWNEWGEHATRWFNEDSNQADWISWLSASRYLRSSVGPTFRTVTFSVVDFRTSTVKRHANRSSSAYLNIPRASSESLKGRNATLETRWSSALRSLWDSSNRASDSGLGSDNCVLVDIVGSDVPTTVDIGFEDPVKSRLPYRSVTRPSPVPARIAWLIDGSHIIGTDFRSGPRHQCLTVYKLKTSAEA